MGIFFQQVFDILTTHPGNLVYHLILTFSAFGALQVVLAIGQRNGARLNRRVVIGLGFLLGARLLLFTGSGVVWLGLANPHLLLPPIDRAVNVISLILIVWLWVVPEPSRPADAAALLISLLVAATGALTYALWSSQGADLNFNQTWMDIGWEALSAALAVAGIVLLILRKPEAWEFGAVTLIIFLAGDAIHLLIADPGSDFPGAVRLAQIAAYPMLFTLAQRIPADQLAEEETTFETIAAEPPPPAELLQIDEPIPAQPKTFDTDVFQSLIELAQEETSKDICQALTKALSKAMIADLCFLVSSSQESGQIVIHCGYDLIKEKGVGGHSLDKSIIPGVAEVFRRGRSLRLRANSTARDLSGMAEALNLIQTGSLLAVPIAEPRSAPVAAVLMLSPYSSHNWTTQEQAAIEEVSPAIARLLQKAQSRGERQMGIEQTLESLEAAQAQNEQIRRENEDLLAQLEAMRLQREHEQAAAQDMDELLTGYEEARETLERLQEENKELETALEALQIGGEQVPAFLPDSPGAEQELQLALEEIASLKESIGKANRKIAELQTQAPESDSIPTEQAEVIASIAQELRQPMSSITGYTDLLLGESVGILGALQRKFLERVKSSTERMNSLVGDLIQITALDSGRVELMPELVDLNAILDETINVTSAQLREKNIILRVDIPEELPRLHADRDALQQILIHLLNNAGGATPVEGEITLRALPQSENSNTEDFILLQVSDTGGGIPTEDIGRVFSRLYRADNPLIQGVGDTGVGLSIAKTLTEALGGRIWVDSEIGHGATFSVLLPVAGDSAHAGAGVH